MSTFAIRKSLQALLLVAAAAVTLWWAQGARAADAAPTPTASVATAGVGAGTAAVGAVLVFGGMAALVAVRRDGAGRDGHGHHGRHLVASARTRQTLRT